MPPPRPEISRKMFGSRSRFASGRSRGLKTLGNARVGSIPTAGNDLRSIRMVRLAEHFDNAVRVALG